MPDRAILFIDGNNWYHALRDNGVRDLNRLDYSRISRKLAQSRDWTGTRYYIGRMDQRWDARAYAAQRSFLARMIQDDPSRISTHLGRLERRTAHSEAAEELLRYLAGLQIRIDPQVYRSLVDLGRRHRSTEILVEKAVDVMLAVDLVVMAERDEYDTAYLLSADGDFTPAVQAAKVTGKRVFAVSMNPGAKLRAACDAFIRPPRSWFDDCYRS